MKSAVCFRSFLFALVLSVMGLARAQSMEDVSSDVAAVETVLVIGLSGGEAMPEIPASAIVIDRQQIARFGNASLANVLAQIPGITINQNGGRGSFNSLFLRGADPNFTQVRIDGVVINDASNSRGGAFDIGSINAQIIERIEIITDASSAVYGSQALAGIINIVTRTSGLEAAFELDSHGGQVGSLFLANEALTLSLVHERPQSALASSQYQSDELGVKATRRWLGKHKLQFIGRVQQYNTEAFPDDSGGELTAVNRKLERKAADIFHFSTRYSYQTGNGDLFELNSSVLKHDERRTTPSIAPGIRDLFGFPGIVSNTDFERRVIEARYTKLMGDRFIWRSALGWEQERGQQQGLLDFSTFTVPTSFDLTREILSFSQSMDINFGDRLQLSFGGRVDDSKRKTVFSPRVSLSAGFDQQQQLAYLTLGKGFKLASLYALADPLIGNDQLQDETAKSAVLGHRFVDESWKIEHNVFHYEFNNLIDFDSGPPPRLLNRDTVSVDGIESVVSYKFEHRWQLDFFQTYTSINVEGSDVELRQRPRYRAGARVEYRPRSTLDLWLRHRYVGERLDSSIPTGDQVLDSYHVSDLGLQWRFKRHWQINAQLLNVFATRHETSIGNVVSDESLLIQLSYRGN